MIKTVYLDLDGVLYDLMKSIMEYDGFDDSELWHNHIHSTKMTFQQYISDAMLKYRMCGLFSKGDIIPDGEKLLADLIEYKNIYNFKIIVLTALYGTMEHYSESSKLRISYDKVFWLQNTLLDGKSIYDYIDEVKIVSTWKDKIDYATDDSILIDDYVGTKMLFDQADMKFIHFKNYEDSISEFKNHVVGELV